MGLRDESYSSFSFSVTVSLVKQIKYKYILKFKRNETEDAKFTCTQWEIAWGMGPRVKRNLHLFFCLLLLVALKLQHSFICRGNFINQTDERTWKIQRCIYTTLIWDDYSLCHVWFLSPSDTCLVAFPDLYNNQILMPLLINDRDSYNYFVCLLILYMKNTIARGLKNLQIIRM